MTGDEVAGALEAVGPRLRALRRERQVTLARLSEETGISVSTLSRLESGRRRPTLALLLPVARAHGVPLDEIVDAPAAQDPRVRVTPVTRHGMTFVPLTKRPGGTRAYKIVLPPLSRTPQPVPQTHDGYEWLYVLTGRIRLVLGEHDLQMGQGEAAEFDTRVPHWFTNAWEHPTELLSLFGPQGERTHLRARPRRRSQV